MIKNTPKFKYFILTGDPGVGKTTLTKKLCTSLEQSGVNVTGFYTEEVRKIRIREGFDVVTLNGQRGRLARDQNLLTESLKHSVGKYGVLIQEFENVALPTLQKPDNTKTCLVIDEIGKMELLSSLFKTRIKEIFSNQSENIVLATIPIRKCDALVESIRNNENAKVWVVTRENRNIIHEEIITCIKHATMVI